MMMSIKLTGNCALEEKRNTLIHAYLDAEKSVIRNLSTAGFVYQQKVQRMILLAPRDKGEGDAMKAKNKPLEHMCCLNGHEHRRITEAQTLTCAMTS